MLRGRAVYAKRTRVGDIPVSAKDYLDTTRASVSSLLLHSEGREPIGKAFDGSVLRHHRKYESGTDGTSNVPDRLWSSQVSIKGTE